MRFIHVVFMAGAVWAGYTVWERSQGSAGADMTGEAYSENGFAQLPEIPAQDADTVYVIAPPGCPKESAQRARQLVADLKEQGIPAVETDSVYFEVGTEPPADLLERMDDVMRGEIPIVIINGRGKSDPSLAEVVAEYQGAGS